MNVLEREEITFGDGEFSSYRDEYTGTYYIECSTITFTGEYGEIGLPETGTIYRYNIDEWYSILIIESQYDTLMFEEITPR
jgi:hypothetical protein